MTLQTDNSRRFHLLGLLLVALALVLGTMPVEAQQGTPRIYTITIDGSIDRGLAPYVERVMSEAEEEDAVAVVVQIDTSGGDLDAALQIRKAILDSPLRTLAFVDGEALSHGALIAISATELYMAPGSVIGAEDAGVREGSALRKRYVATAEERGRDPRVAEAMVTGVVTVDGFNEPGQALTLTSEEAYNIGFVDALVPDVDGLLEVAGFDTAQIVETSPSIAEDLVRVLTNPIVAALLFAAGLVLLVGDLLAGGISLLAALGFLLLTVFFWGHILAGLAGWEGVALVALGVLLIGVEAFILPGFGVAGVAGIASVLAGFYLSMIGGEIVTRDDYVNAIGAVALVVIIAVAGAFLFLWLLPGTVKFHGMVLSTNLNRDEPVTAELVASAPESPVANPELGEPANRHGLTEREIDVLRLIAAGRTNKEAADELHLSVRTIERHVTNLYAKIGASNRAEATAYAFREKFA